MATAGDESLVALYGDALDFAASMQEDLNSFHFLLSFFTTPSEVAVLLEDLSISSQMVTDGYKDYRKNIIRDGGKITELEGAIKKIEKRTISMLQSTGEAPSALHFMCAIANERECIANRILDHIGVLNNLRLHGLSMLTTPAKRIHARMGQLKKESTRITPEKDTRQRTAVAEKEHDEPAASIVKAEASKPQVEIPVTEQASAVNSHTNQSLADVRLPEVFAQLGRNLTELARKGGIDGIYGREKEFETILDILCRKKNNNPCIVGSAGSGKTAIVEGIAYKQHKDGILPDKIIWELNVSALISGTEYRGSLEKRINELITQVEQFKDNIVVFIDEIHLINTDANDVFANMLKPALSRGNFPLIGATTPDEFKKFIAKDPAMERRFTIVNISEPEGEELFHIVVNAASHLSEHHKVLMNKEDTVRSAIRLSNRYISGKSQPDKVLSLLDTLGAVLARGGKTDAAESDIMDLVSSQTGIPVDNLLVDGAKILRVLPERLALSIKGQERAKRKIVQLLARRFNRKAQNKPIASFIFVGPTGVGKTETAKKLADFFFGSEKRMVVFDMSEFQEQHSVSRLIGSPPGYTGYDDGGQLTEAFRREPYQLLLLDEIEKANPKVLGIMLQLLEEGRIADSRGFTVNMSEAIVVMTTNIGAEEFTTSKVGFGSTQDESEIAAAKESQVLSKLEKFLSPELINRVDESVVFTPFSESEWRELTISMINKMSENLKESYNVSINLINIEEIAQYLLEQLGGKDKNLGARAMQRVIEKNMESLVLDHMYTGGGVTSLEIFFDGNLKKISIK